YDGVLGFCSLSPSIGGLQYLQPKQDRFDETLGIVERYQAWTNDSQVQEMANLLRTVGSERNVTEASGNLTLGIYSGNYAQYIFYNTFNGVDYTGLTVFMSSSYVDFSDSRVFEKIGDTTINVSEEQAVDIAKNYLKTYSYNATLGNGTRVTVSNLNVTGVDSTSLQTGIRENSTL